MSLFTQRIFCVYNSGNCINTSHTLPHVLSPVNETITHKSQNELMFSINRGELSDVMSSESITVVWFPKSLPVRKLKSYMRILK